MGGKKKSSKKIAAAPPRVAEYAAGCVHFVEKALKMRLDFEPETLSILDHYGSMVRPTLDAESIEASDDLLQLIASVMGCYFGEVIRKRYDCR